MDAQYPFASRDDIWRVLDELKDLHAAQFEQAERIARLERRRDEDARLRSVWGPLSPFPTPIGGSVAVESAYHSPTDAFKGFDQGQQHGIINTMGMDAEDEPRRGTSRANSVRFDESAIHGYYGQASRSTSELPLRTGSGLASLPLTERSLSHRSDGRLSSSGHSHHSARTNSLGLETTSRMMSSSVSDSPLIPPPGLFLLGPVPCIIRCWLTTNFSNDSLLYAAICSGSYMSSLGYPMVRKLGLEDLMTQDEDSRFIKLPLYLPEARVHQSSSRCSSPEPQLPTLTIRFLVRNVDPNDQSIQIVLGSDVLRSHNADILFSQDKIIMVDDERNKVSIPLVRPENDTVFRSLCTASDTSLIEPLTQLRQESEPQTNGHTSVGIIGQPTVNNIRRQSTSVPASARVPVEEKPPSRPSNSHHTSGDTTTQQGPAKSPAVDVQPATPTAPGANIWGSWRRDAKPDPAAPATTTKPARGRTMKVLRPTKSSARISTASTAQGSTDTETQPSNNQHQPTTSRVGTDESHRPNKTWGSNPIGGASAFGWLNSSQPRQFGNNPK